MRIDKREDYFGEIRLMTSILVPTKGRLNNIKNLFNNLSQTIEDPQTIELFVLYDEGEQQWKDSTPYNYYVLEREHSDYLNRDYYNYLAEISIGNYLWGIGDDVKFITKGWDKILQEKVEEYLKDKPDRLAYISVSEDRTKALHPCFPLITRESFNSLNMYFHPELLSWGADRCLYELYEGIDRILHIPEIHIEHLSYHNDSGIYDDTAKSIKERFFRNPDCHNKVTREVIPRQIKLLKEVICEKEKLVQ